MMHRRLLGDIGQPTERDMTMPDVPTELLSLLQSLLGDKGQATGNDQGALQRGLGSLGGAIPEALAGLLKRRLPQADATGL